MATSFSMNHDNDNNHSGVDAPPPLPVVDELSWEEMPCMKLARAGCASVTIGSTVYVVGGFSGSLSASCHAVEALTVDSESSSSSSSSENVFGRRRVNSTSRHHHHHTRQQQQWKVVTQMRHRRNRCSASPLGRHKLVVIGGYKNTAELYDTSTKSWSELPKMKCKRHGCASATLNDKVYVFGGCSAFASSADVHAMSAEVYDARTKRWTGIAPMPTPRSLCAAVALDDRTILVLGGKSKWNGPALNVVEAYDTFTNTWSILPNMTTPRAGLATGVVKTDGGEAILIVVGGNDSSPSSTSAAAELYMDSRKAWTSLPAAMLQSATRQDCTIAVVGNQVLAMGGKTHSGEALRSVEKMSLDALVQTSCVNGTVTLPELPSPPPTTSTTPQDEGYMQSLETYADQIEDAMIKVTRTKTALLTDLRRTHEETLLPLQTKMEQLQETMRKVQEAIRRVDMECRESVEAVEDEVGPWMREADGRAREARGLVGRWRKMQQGLGEECVVNCGKKVVSVEVSSCKEDGRFVEEEEGEEQRQDSTLPTNANTQTLHTETSMHNQPSHNHNPNQDTFTNQPSNPPENNNNHPRTTITNTIHIPQELLCKINGELMQDPVLAMDGHTYERHMICMWFAQFPPHRHPRSPVTNDLLPSRHLVRNYTVRSLCREFVEGLKEEEGGSTRKGEVESGGEEVGHQFEIGNGGGGVGMEEVAVGGLPAPITA